MMKIAICLFNYFPFGGLQRDFLRIARECVSRGHEIHVYTMRWEGEREPSLNIHIIPVKGLTNHGQAKSFSDQVGVCVAEFDMVVGFNKMPHLDLYYAADVCYQARIKVKRWPLYRCMPRYRAWLNLEQSVFAPESQTSILLLSELQRSAYAGCYGTPLSRFHLLPPGISRDRLAPAPEDAQKMRESLRAELGLTEQDTMLLMVGSGYKTKGLDRALIGLAHLPSDLRQTTYLYVIGKSNAAPFKKMAQRLGITEQVRILGARDDVPNYLLAADLLLHPSYHENTGTAILEALAAGLPVLTTDVCGYAHYVTDAEAGVVLSSPFIQKKWDDALQQVLSSSELTSWGDNGLTFAKQADIYSMPQRATDLIENWVKQRDTIS